jgi:hypothetical protein
MKALKHLYTSMRLSHLPALPLTKVNGAHSFEDAGGKCAKTKRRVRSAAGRAWTAGPVARFVVPFGRRNHFSRLSYFWGGL